MIKYLWTGRQFLRYLLSDNLFKINFTLNEVNTFADVVEHEEKTNLEILACLYPKKEIRS